MRQLTKGALLAGAALIALTSPALAESQAEKIRKLEEQIKALSSQVQDLKIGTASKFAESKRSVEALPAVTLKDGRPTFKTADGDFSASLRVLAQFDTAYYIQDNDTGVPAAGGRDLSSGTNFRRARFGIDGTLFKSWDYAFWGEFGGSGVEGNALLQQAWLQYSGWNPFLIRAGVFRPNLGLEDATGSGDTLFLERSSVVEITSQIAGADGREGLSLTYAPGAVDAPGRLYAQVAYTGNKVTTSGANFDEQQGATGRLAGLVYTDPLINVLIGVGGSYAWDLPDTAAATPGGNVTFADRPELRVDGTNLITTTNNTINAQSVYHYGVDGGINFKNLYAEAGYFQFGADRRASSVDPEFSGYYVQGSWVITGEQRRYDYKTASWRAPKVKNPLAITDPLTGVASEGWGAWELAARYSAVDLDYHAGTAGAAVPAGGVRGGEQEIWTGALNWYANAAVRVGLQYQWVDVERLNTGAGNTQIGQDFQTVAARVQFGF